MQAEKEHWVSLLESFPPLLGCRQGSCRTAVGTDPSLEVKVEEHRWRVSARRVGIAAAAS